MNSNERENNDKNHAVTSSFEIVDDENKCLIEHSKENGISWQVASLFVTGEILGGGAVAIADGMVNSGWYGFIIVFIGFFSTLFVSERLAQAVNLAISSDKSKERHRHPYTFTITKALGEKWKMVVSILLNITSTCITTVYLLISTELFSLVINDIFPSFQSKYEFRIFLVIIAVALIPIMLLGSPKDFWGVALFATLTTMFAVAISTVLLCLDAPKTLDSVPRRTISPYSFFYGFGTIFFAFCGVPFLPNIQMDLAKPNTFSKSIYCGFVAILLTYIPILLTGFLTLGDNANGNIVYNIFNLHLIVNKAEHYKVYKVMSYVTLILFAGHFTFAYNLIFNSTAQELEDYIKAPRGFCWQRCMVRIGLIILTFALAQLIPSFNTILSFVGGTLLVIISFHLPILSYFKLKQNIHFVEKIMLIALLILSTIGVGGSLYTSTLNVIKIYE